MRIESLMGRCCRRRRYSPAPPLVGAYMKNQFGNANLKATPALITPSLSKDEEDEEEGEVKEFPSCARRDDDDDGLLPFR